VKAALVAVALVACSSDSDRQPVVHERVPPRHLPEPVGTMHSLPPHPIRSDGIGPYTLGDGYEGRLERVGCGAGVGAGRWRAHPAACEESVDAEPKPSKREKYAGNQRGPCCLRRHGIPLSTTRGNIAKLLKKSAFFLDALVVKKGQYAIAS